MITPQSFSRHARLLAGAPIQPTDYVRMRRLHWGLQTDSNAHDALRRVSAVACTNGTEASEPSLWTVWVKCRR